MQETITEFGLSPQQFLELFPFHVVINRQYKIVQIGLSIRKFDPSIEVGQYLDQAFEPNMPTSLLNWGYLRSIKDQISVIRHKSTQIDFSGRILPTHDDCLIFLIRPLLDTDAHLAKIGLSISDFAHHDPVNELFTNHSSKKHQPQISLEQALANQELQLKEIYTQLSRQEDEARKLAHIISRLKHWIIVADASGKVEWVNEAFKIAAGYAANQLPPEDIFTLLGLEKKDLSKPYLELRSSIASSADPTDPERERWMEVDIRPLLDDQQNIINLIAICRDVTAQRQAELLSQRLTNELNHIFDLSPDGIVSFNQDGQLSQVNSAFLKMTGFDEAEIKSIGIYDLEKKLSQIISVDQSTAQQRDAEELIINLHSPKSRTIRRSFRESYDHAGLYLGVVHYFQDITHEYELSRMKGEFLSMAAHELRTPMSSIYGFTDLLIKRKYSEDQQRDILQNVFRQSTRMIRLINDLLELARIESKTKYQLNIGSHVVSKIVETAVSEFSVNADGHPINVRLQTEDIEVQVDFDKIIQALINILSNAHKYSPVDREITIDLIERSVNESRQIGIRVSDRGRGMSPYELSHVFDRFYRANETDNVQGTGLGMCIVKEIMELNDGQVEVVSSQGSGTQVTLWMPTATASVMMESE